MLTQEHVQTAREFLADADEEFAAGDVLQASEKMWGAATHAVIAVAQRRGWLYGGHREMRIVVERLAQEHDDPTLSPRFSVAEKLHANFYHGFMEPFQMEPDRHLVRDFVVRVLVLTE